MQNLLYKKIQSPSLEERLKYYIVAPIGTIGSWFSQVFTPNPRVDVEDNAVLDITCNVWIQLLIGSIVALPCGYHLQQFDKLI